jgi:DNA end-binding protein Ku
MKQLTAAFNPENFKDDYESRVEQLIESKQGHGAGPAKEPKKKLAPVIDLMDALRKSMAQQPTPAVAEEEPAKKPPQPAVAQRKRKVG